MTRRSNWDQRRSRGAVAVVMALCLIPLTGILAFAIDAGMMLAAKRRAQTVADAGALAAACQLFTNAVTDPTGQDASGKARAATLLNASANGFTNDGTTNKVQVNIPPSNLSQLWQGKPFYAEVIVTYYQPRFFSGILGSGSLAIGARAVARGTNGSPAPYTNASIVALNSKASSALSITGGVNLAADSPVQIDSSSSTALTVNNGANATASVFQVVGGYSKAIGSSINGSVSTGAPSIADPLASLTAPDPATLAQRSFTSTYGVATLSPGVYNGGLNLGNGMNITLQPGVYYVKGGDFNVGGGVNLTGIGVTIYLDTGSQLSIQGGANVSMTPPTSGSLAGLSVFANRSNTSALNFANGSNVNIGGTIYAAGAALSIAGGSNVHAGSQVIVDTFSLSNGANIAFTTASDAKKGFVASKPSSPSIAVVE